MEENPIPIYVVEFMTDEWKTWTLFSLIFISFADHGPKKMWKR